MESFTTIKKKTTTSKAYKKLVAIIREFRPDITYTCGYKVGTLRRLSEINCSVLIILHTLHGHVFIANFGKLKHHFTNQ